MKPFRLLTPLEWRQRGVWRSAYDLSSAGEPVGEMRPRKWWSGDDIFTTTADEWTFASVGTWRPRVIVRSRSGGEVALFHPDTWNSGGHLDFGPGRHFQIFSHPWKFRIEVRRGDSPTPIVTANARGVFRTGATLDIHPSLESDPEAPVLVAFSFYRLIDVQNSSAIATTA